MSKKRRKKKKAVKPVEAKAKKPFPKKRALTLLAVTAALFIIYELMIAFELLAVVHIYWIGLAVLAMIYIALNRGTFRPLSPDKLPDEWSDEKKRKLIKEQERRFEMSRPLLYIIIGIMLTLLFDTAYIFASVNLGLDI